MYKIDEVSLTLLSKRERDCDVVTYTVTKRESMSVNEKDEENLSEGDNIQRIYARYFQQYKRS